MAIPSEDSILNKMKIRIVRMKRLKEINAPKIIIDNEMYMIVCLAEKLVESVPGQ